MIKHRTGEGWLPWIARLAVMGPILVGAVPARADSWDHAPEGGPQTDADVVAPNPWRWDAFGATSDRSGFTTDGTALRAARAPGDHLSLLRTTGLTPAPSALLITFNITLSGAKSRTTTAQVFRVGAGFSPSTGDESDAVTFARLGLNTTGSGSGFQLRDLVTGTNSRTFSGTQAVTWVLNRSGGPLSYPAPDGSTRSIADGRMDAWVGRNPVFDGALATSPGASLSGFKWLWTGAAGVTTLDHLDVAAFPSGDAESPDAAPLAGAAAGAGANGAAEALAAGSTLELYRPTPNPFDRTMHFAYAVPKGGARVAIGVYDVAGRRVWSLAPATRSGATEIRWDGTRDDGGRTRPGVYLLRVRAGDAAYTRRVVHLE